MLLVLKYTDVMHETYKTFKSLYKNGLILQNELLIFMHVEVKYTHINMLSDRAHKLNIQTRIVHIFVYTNSSDDSR